MLAENGVLPALIQLYVDTGWGVGGDEDTQKVADEVRNIAGLGQDTQSACTLKTLKEIINCNRR